MKKYFFKICIALCLATVVSLAIDKVYAQTACPGAGGMVSGASFGGETHAIGDVSVAETGASDVPSADDADWYLASGANIDIYAALNIPAGTVMRLKSGAVLNVYGDIVNDGTFFIEAGAIINFYGNTWTNSSTAVVGDGAATVNTIPGGTVNFIAARPSVPASASPTPCVMSNYSGGNFAQNIDGGNVPMDIALHVKNANNINLINTDTKLEGNIIFDIADGDINIGNNDFVFTTNGNWNTTVAPNAAYFLTNGNTNCAGAVEKLGLPSGQTFTFPIGRVETYSSGRDFTPAMIRNDGAATDDFQVRVKNYADAISIGGVVITAPAEGMDRAWQITSTNGSGVTMNLQHNSATNGTTYQTIFGGDPTAFVTQYQGAGIWNTGTVPTAIAGTVSGSMIHTMGYAVTTTATTCTQPKSWFSKSNDPLTPLPVSLTSFTAASENCKVKLNWKTVAEINFDRFEIERSNDGTNYTSISTITATGNNSNYNYTDNTPKEGKNIYRLKMTDIDGKYTYSALKLVTFSCTGNKAIVIYPNPASDYINISISGYTKQITGKLFNAIGQLHKTVILVNGTNNISANGLANGVYNLVIIDEKGNRNYYKVMIQH